MSAAGQQEILTQQRGLECDRLYENGNGIGAIEIKSGATIASDYFDALKRISADHLGAARPETGDRSL